MMPLQVLILDLEMMIPLNFKLKCKEPSIDQIEMQRKRRTETRKKEEEIFTTDFVNKEM